MEIAHLKYFYEVARLGGFTRAAQSLKVSQPSISKIVRQFESANDLVLLERNRGGVRLTPVGRMFFEHCERIFSEVEGLRQGMSAHRGDSIGDLDFGASDNLCNYVLPEMLRQFSLTYPRVNIRLFSGTSRDIQNEILKGDLEFGLFYTPPDHPRLVHRSLYFVEFVIVCAPEHPLLKHSQLRPEIFERYRYIGSRASDYRKQCPALLMHQRLGIKPRQFFETNNQETQKKMALSGYGYTVVPRHMVEEELKSRLLQVIPTEKRLGTPLLLTQKKNQKLSGPAERFIDNVRTQRPSPQ